MSEINWDQLDEIYRAAAPANGGMGPVPDGTYQTKVHTVDFKVSKADHAYLFWVLEILEGAYAGRNLLKRHMLQTAKNMSHFKKDVAMCGIDPPDGLAIFSDGDRRGGFLKSLLDVGLVCRQKTKGEFIEVYFEAKWSHAAEAPKRIERIEPITTMPVEVSAQGTFADDDIPF